MQIGDLVKAPCLMDHDGSVGLIIGFVREKYFQPAVKIFFISGTRIVYCHLVEVISANR